MFFCLRLNLAGTQLVQDGISQIDEILSLTDAGVRSLDLDTKAIDGAWSFGNTVAVNQGTYICNDGTRMGYADIALTALSGPEATTTSYALRAAALSQSRADTRQSWGRYLGANPTGSWLKARISKE